MRNTRIQSLVEIALCVGLFAVLQTISIRYPFGGGINFSMVPIVVLALRRGPVVGVICGVFCGLVDLMIEPYIVHYAQVVLDYPLAYGAVGLSGLLSPVVKKFAYGAKNWLAVGALGMAGAVLGGALRLIPAWTSGVIFFAANAPEGQNVGLYSLIYNVGYILPSVILVGIVTGIALPALMIAFAPDDEINGHVNP